MRTRRRLDPERRNILLFVGVSAVSGFGGTALNVVAGVWVLDLSGSGSVAALTGLCLFAPTLLGPLLGAAVDRLPRQRLVVWTHLLTAVAVLSLLAVRSEAQVWIVYVVMLGYGTSLVLVDVAENALLPAALPPHELGKVNGMRTSAQEGMKLVAPLAGAGLFAWRGGYPVVALTALALVLAGGLYRLLRIRTDVPTVPGTAGHSAAESGTGRHRSGTGGRGLLAGAAFLWRHPELRTCVLIGSTTIGMSGLTTAAVYAVVTEDLHQPAAFVGVLSSAQGAGSLLGGLLVPRLLRTRGSLAVGALGAALFALGTLGRLVPWTPAAVACSVLVGIGLPWTLVAAVTAVQSRTPGALLGRVSGSASTLLFAPVAITTPVGAALVLPDHRLPLLVAAVLCLGVGPVTLRMARRADHPGTEAGPATEPPWDDAGPSGPAQLSGGGTRSPAARS
ncbi:MFS transporter [Micromonospora sp. WMMD1102]|uniref:MFS transporter n=1 Tax=Micromonospora sp. WMMD1102 TaxID=3016105 RepID=UPI0024155A98|nr:MFS transporter [Micromonospora sp. WMMD1102]MDG4788376.1 MFS transporter [Micromonospora sp. WMMD1102]